MEKINKPQADEGMAQELAALKEENAALKAEIEKLKAESAVKDKAEVAAVAHPVPMDILFEFRKKYPKEKYMVLHRIKHGDKDGSKVFEPGNPFDPKHPAFKNMLKAGNVVQVDPE